MISEAAAFESIVEQHRAAVYGVLRARLTRSDEALALTKDVFRTFHESRTKLDADADVRTTLLDLAMRRLHERHRATRASQPASWTALCLDLSDAGPCASAGDVPQLIAALNRLEPAEREAIEWMTRSNWTPAQIAERLRRSESAVRQLLSRARRKLGRELAESSRTEVTGDSLQDRTS